MRIKDFICFVLVAVDLASAAQAQSRSHSATSHKGFTERGHSRSAYVVLEGAVAGAGESSQLASHHIASKQLASQEALSQQAARQYLPKEDATALSAAHLGTNTASSALSNETVVNNTLLIESSINVAGKYDVPNESTVFEKERQPPDSWQPSSISKHSPHANAMSSGLVQGTELTNLFGRPIVPTLYPQPENCGHLLSAASPMLSWLLIPFPYGLYVFTGLWTIVLMLTWACPFFSLETKEQAADRVLGLVHALVSLALGISAELRTHPMCQVGDCWVRGAVQVTLGFLIVDAVSMFVCDVIMQWRPADYSMFLHHALICGFFTYGCQNDFGVWFFVTLLINEASTPLLHVMWYLSYTGQKSSFLFVFNGVCLIIVFFLCRILFIPFSFSQLADVGFCPIYGAERYAIFVPSYAAIYMLNMFWFCKMVDGARRKIFGDSKKDEAPEGVQTPPRRLSRGPDASYQPS